MGSFFKAFLGLLALSCTNGIGCVCMLVGLFFIAGLFFTDVLMGICFLGFIISVMVANEVAKMKYKDDQVLQLAVVFPTIIVAGLIMFGVILGRNTIRDVQERFFFTLQTANYVENKILKIENNYLLWNVDSIRARGGKVDTEVEGLPLTNDVYIGMDVNEVINVEKKRREENANPVCSFIDDEDVYCRSELYNSEDVVYGYVYGKSINKYSEPEERVDSVLSVLEKKMTARFGKPYYRADSLDYDGDDIDYLLEAWTDGKIVYVVYYNDIWGQDQTSGIEIYALNPKFLKEERKRPDNNETFWKRHPFRAIFLK